MPPSKQDLVLVGPMIHSVSRDQIGFYDKVVIHVRDGKIVAVDETGGLDVDKLSGEVVRLSEGQFLCPGLIDLHIHAPQYPNIGLGLDLPLLDWLHTYTFPLETKFADITFAEKIYRYAVKSSLWCGTTTAVYHGTIHWDSTVKLGQVIHELGQRAILGKVAMNQNCPDTYSEGTRESLENTVKFVQGIQQLQSELVIPAVTPRFAVACDMPLLTSLAKYATDNRLYIQTHISENKKEVEFVRDLFPECQDYTDVYDKSGLLTHKTILAHGVYLSERELGIIRERGSCVAHCPSSNTYLQSGLCDVRRLWQHDVRVGLGTDVSGGVNPSILDSVRSALTTSSHLSMMKEGYKPLDYQEAFYLATLGAAQAIGMDKEIGNFQVGKEFDALLVDMEQYDGAAGTLETHSLKELTQKFIYCGSSRNIRSVYVAGSLVKTEH